MYAKGKLNSVPSDAQAQEKLALYVYEYLVHIGAQKSAQTFLSEINWDKNITLGEPPGFLCSWWCVFWDLYCAAPERRDNCEHSGEATAFHDYNFTNSCGGLPPPPPMHQPPPGDFFPPPPPPPMPPQSSASVGGRGPGGVGHNGGPQRLPPPPPQSQLPAGGPMPQYRPPPPRSSGPGSTGGFGGQMMAPPWQQQQQQDPRMMAGPSMPPPQQQMPEQQQQQQTAENAAIQKIKEDMQKESERLVGGSGFDADFFGSQQP